VSTASSIRQHLDRALFSQVDASSLVVFRLMFGVLMLIEVYRYFDNGWIKTYFIDPTFMFKYYGFGWIQPLAGSGMYWVFVVLGFAALGITIGAFYRVATILFLACFSYVFLLDEALYLNHFYLIILISFLLVLVPANRTWAVDAWMRPKLRSDTVPGWSIWIFRLQMEVVLLYAGVVKLNPDWVRLEPMGMWLARRADLPIVGQYFTEDWVVAVASYGAIALHLIGAPLLLFRRTRLYAIAIYTVFHLMNVVLFSIGVFPWMTVAATLLFLDPDWPKQVARKLNEWQGNLSADKAVPPVVETAGPESVSPGYKRVVVCLMVIWLAYQIFFPLRHALYSGYVSWTEEGHNFSWQMMLRTKRSDAHFVVRDPRTLAVREVRLEEYLNPEQVSKMIETPDMMLQFAQYLVRDAEERGTEGLQVWARACVTLNGRKEAWLVDPLRDLSTVERKVWPPADWILPLDNPPERPPLRTGRAELHCRLPSPGVRAGG